MQRFFGGNISRRQALGVGVATSAAFGMANAAQCAPDPMGGPTPAGRDEYKPHPEQVTVSQSFHLNFTEADGHQEVAGRLQGVLKRLGHTYPGTDIGAIAYTITCGNEGSSRFEDGVLQIGWHRPTSGHLVVWVRLEMTQAVADLPSNWRLNLLG